jgi:hypothetical protein
MEEEEQQTSQIWKHHEAVSMKMKKPKARRHYKSQKKKKKIRATWYKLRNFGTHIITNMQNLFLAKRERRETDICQSFP